MTAARFIFADGIEWPLDTYLDAYRFVRVDSEELPRIEADPRVIVVEGATSGKVNLAEPQFASAVCWPNAIAFRFLDHVGDVQPCHSCGTSGDADAWCDECLADAEYC